MTQDEKGLHVSPGIYDALKSKLKKRDVKWLKNIMKNTN